MEHLRIIVPTYSVSPEKIYGDFFAAKINDTSPNAWPPPKRCSRGSNQMPKLRNEPLAYSKVVRDCLKNFNGKMGPILGDWYHSAPCMQRLPPTAIFPSNNSGTPINL